MFKDLFREDNSIYQKTLYFIHRRFSQIRFFTNPKNVIFYSYTFFTNRYITHFANYKIISHIIFNL